MGGAPQTRLRPDRAKSNAAEGSADFPQARRHFSLNNSYEGSDSSEILSPTSHFYRPLCSFCRLLSPIAAARYSRLYGDCFTSRAGVPGGSSPSATGGVGPSQWREGRRGKHLAPRVICGTRLCSPPSRTMETDASRLLPAKI